ncbi:MAG: hypothetical protein JHC71_12855 [Blastococcus sp.]|nr:hypothetical protein [Blastococcus sp.]
MTLVRKVLASLATVGAAAGLMVFGTVGEFTPENAGFPRSSIDEVPAEHTPR